MSQKSRKDVMSDPGAFRQQVRMAAVQVDGLRPDELAMALAYEIEPFSGIPAAEAELAYNPVTEADQSIRAYDVAVRRRRGRGGEPGGERWLKPLAVVGAALLLAAAADFACLAWRTNRLQKTVDERMALDARIKSIADKARANRDEAARLRASRAEAAAAQDRLERLRAAYSTLMDIVAVDCGGRMVVKRFASDGVFSVEMRAAAVSAQACGEAMSQLAGAVAARGWRMEPGEIEASPHGATAEFSCRFLLDGEGKQEGRDGH